MATPEQQFGDRELRWQLSGQLYRLGRIEEGLEIVEGLVAEVPEAERERLLQGLMLGALGRDEEAVAVYEDMRQDQLGNLVVIGELVKIHERNGRLREAEEVLRAAEEFLRSEGGWAEARFHLLNHLWRTQSWGDLVEASEEFVDDPESPLYRQGVFFYVDGLHGKGDSSRALEVLADLPADRVPGHRVLAKEAEILADLGRSKEADGKLALLAERGDLASLLAVAEVYHGLERYTEAVGVLERARLVGGDSNQVLYWLGAAYERGGNREQAAEVFEALLRNDPGYAPALNYLGYMWAEEGENLEEALTLVIRAVAQEPDNGAYVDSLAWAHFQRGEYRRARTLLERASRLIPNDPVIAEHLGDVYSRLGDWIRAGDLYRRALELGTDDEDELRRKLDQLPDSR
jgi:tetratricopeptide (TPR) repeat protein